MNNNIKIAKTQAEVNDNKLFPIVNVSYLEKDADVAIAESYGVHGSAPIGTQCVMLIINNDEANRIIIPLSAQTRTRDLEENEFECGNFVIGSIINFDKDGNINITSNNDINIIAGGGDINITGDIHVTGNIDVTGDVVADKGSTDISLRDHLNTGVTPGGSNTGPPV